MRKWWKIAGAALLIPFGAIRGIVDAVGEVQTVNGLPIVKWLIHPYFSLGAFAGATVFGAWAIYDYRIKKEPAGFVGIPENKRRYLTQVVLGVVIILVLFVLAPLIYGRYHRKLLAEQSGNKQYVNDNAPVSQNGPIAVPKQTSDTTVSAKQQTPSPSPTKKHSSSKQKPKSPPPSVDNSVTVGGDISQTSQGNCSPNIVGGSSTVYCAPVPSEVSWNAEAITAENTLTNAQRYGGSSVGGSMREEEARTVKTLSQNPGLLITVSSKNSWSTGSFSLAAKCNRPCFGINTRLEGASGWTPQFHATGRQTQLIFLTPAVVLPAMRVLWEVRSLDRLPIMVSNVELIALQ